MTRPPRPVPSTVGRIDALVGHHLARGGQRRDAAPARLPAAPREPRLALALRLGLRPPARGGRGARGFGVDDRDDLVADVTVAPSALTISTSTPSPRRRQLEHDLVGLDVDQVLVALHRLAGLLVPVDERRLGDRLRAAAGP